MGCYKIIQQELYVPRMGRTGIRDRLQSDKIIRLRCHKFGPFHNRHTVYNTNQAPAYTKHKRGNSFFSTLLERQVSRNCNISCTLKKDNLLNLPGQICSRSQCRTVGPLAARECTSTFPVVGRYYVKRQHSFKNKPKLATALKTSSLATFWSQYRNKTYTQ